MIFTFEEAPVPRTLSTSKLLRSTSSSDSENAVTCNIQKLISDSYIIPLEMLIPLCFRPWVPSRNQARRLKGIWTCSWHQLRTWAHMITHLNVDHLQTCASLLRWSPWLSDSGCALQFFVRFSHCKSILTLHKSWSIISGSALYHEPSEWYESLANNEVK